MIMFSLKRQVKNTIEDISDRQILYQSRKNEIKKFKDARRRAIYSSVSLTKEQETQIDIFYEKHYGEKIPYTWHKYYTAFTGNFDKLYFPELLFIPEFERFMNQDKEYVKVFQDKNVTPIFAKNAGVKTPKLILSSTCGILRDESGQEILKDDLGSYLRNAGAIFAKPSIDSDSGVGCIVAEIKNGIDIKSNRKWDDIVVSLGKDFLIQERLKNHKSISNIYSGSVNTFRVIMYRWRDKYYHMPILMRIGQGGNFLDNAHAGGMFIGVDDDGTLHKEAFTEFLNRYDTHPDTAIRFENYKIEGVPAVIAAAEKTAISMPQIGCFNFDFTIDEDGTPILIEANIGGGSIWLSEIAHGCGAFGERTEEILEWLKLMKKLNVRERRDHKFGYM